MKTLRKIISYLIAEEAKIDHRAIVNFMLDDKRGPGKLPKDDSSFFFLPPIEVKEIEDLKRLDDGLSKLMESA